MIDGDIVIPNESASIADYLRASSTLVFNEEPIILDGQEGTFNTITVANGMLTILSQKRLSWRFSNWL